MTHLSPFFAAMSTVAAAHIFTQFLHTKKVPPEHKHLPGQLVTLHLSLSALLSSLLVYDGTGLKTTGKNFTHISDLMAQFSIV